MANVTMDLNELKSLENKIIKAKEETENVKNDLQNKIDALQKEKENLIKNQKRVILTKVIKRQIYTMPFDWIKMRETLVKVLMKIDPNCFTPEYIVPSILTIEPQRFVNSVVNTLYNENGNIRKEYENIAEEKEVKKEYEFINLDTIPKLKAETKYNTLIEENKKLKEQNVDLQSQLHTADANKKKELFEQKEIYELKYKELEQEFANFKGDKDKMTLENKLIVLQEQNKRLIEENTKLKNKRWKLW